MNGFNKSAKRLVAAVLAALLLMMSAVPAMAETFSAIVTSKTMAVYGDVSMSQKLGTLEKNSVVRVVGYSTSIAKISYKGRVGYARISDMKKVDDIAKKAVLNASAPIYQSPDPESLSVTGPQGVRLYVLAVQEDWAMVEREGAVGYVKTGFLTATDDEWNVPQAVATATAPQTTQESGISVRTYFAVTVESVKVYKSANTKASLLGTLKQGVQVTVLATSDDWAYIELNGKRG